jgi:hypothetical protein
VEEPNPTIAFAALRRSWGTLVALVLVSGVAWAGGPRYVTGPPFFTGPAGVPVGWKQANLMYYTDPGDLSGSVNHAAADALVAAAAGVWNVPVASISVGQGGELAEHVSGANVYLSSDGMVWPADVESSNAAAIPVAVVYDSDGSVTDTLLGAGASDPIGCEQNAVTETVDAFDPAGYILHAILVVNGRCTGPAPEQQLQMQYKLERAFGRVLGLAWSQANDNVFTGTPQPTYNQANHWPLMHPLEILCGPYSYQCLPNAFTLRPDDVAGLVSIYPIAAGTTPTAGKRVSLADATAAQGFIAFPDTEGMSGVNVLMTREPSFTQAAEGWYEVAAVSGSRFQLAGSSPFVAADTTAQGSMGSTASGQRGEYHVAYVDLAGSETMQNEILSTEPLNPLYTGSASVGVYGAGVAAPGGSPPAPVPLLQMTPGQVAGWNLTIADAPAACGNGADGTMSAPMEAPASGWWNGLLCGYGHAAYAAVDVKAGRSLTVEVTALDANGLATTAKAMPVIGLFAPADAVGALPSLGVAPTAFNSMCTGTTTLTAAPFAAGTAGGVVRVGVADERGDGRPDFADQTRVFYADSVTPELVPAAVGAGAEATTLRISGMGFRAGNEVVVNGVVAEVVSWTSTTIVATAPSLSGAGATAGTPVDVEVLDLGTGATSTMTGALTYDVNAQVPNTMLLVSAETAPWPAGSAAAIPFAVQVLRSDGVTPVAGDTVAFSTTAGSAQFGICGAARCSVTTDANGMASTTVEPLAAGTVTMQAVDGAGSGGASVSASFLAGQQVSSLLIKNQPSGNLTVGKLSPTGFAVNVIGSNGNAFPGPMVTFSVASGSIGSAALGPCNATSCTVPTNTWGGASVSVTPTAAGAVTLVATSGTAQAQAAFTAVAPVNELTLHYAPNVPAYVNEGAGSLTGKLTLSDGVTPLTNTPLTFTAPAGVVFSFCGKGVCTIDTDYTGAAGTGMEATMAGTYTLTVSAGALSQSVQLVATVRQPQLKIVSAPTGNVPVGTVAAQALTAQLLDKYGNPWSGMEVTLGGPLGEVEMSCEGTAGSCVQVTDRNGMATSQVTPVMTGTITLEAVFNNLVVQSSFTSVGPGETFTLATPPPATVNVGTPLSFTMQAIGPDGVTPEVNQAVVVTIVSGNFECPGYGYGNCNSGTGKNGMATVKGTSWAPGPVVLQAVMDGLTLVVTFNVVQPAQTMKVVSAPSGTFHVGASIQPAFAVQVVGADGATGVSGQNVTFSATGATGASVSIAACAMPCVVKTNASGMASTGAIGVSGSGAVSIAAVDNGMTQTASFAVVAPPDLLALAGAPSSVFDGATAATPFAVKVTLADGVTPAAGIAVNFSLGAGAGAAAFTVCGAASCILTTNAAGLASSLVTGTQVGNVTLEATAQLPTGAATVSAALVVQANALSVTASVAQFYVAAGATIAETLGLTAIENGSAAAGQTVNWTGGSGFTVNAGSSTTSASGAASMQAAVGPLGGGVSATASGCVWSTVCAQFTATGISAELWQVAVVSGGNQAASGGASLNPVIAQVTDGAGHSLPGAAVTIGQTVRAFDASCPAEGRCPAGAVLASGAASAVSDANGEVSVTPMVVPGVATETSLAFSAGLQGFATAVVSSVP